MSHADGFGAPEALLARNSSTLNLTKKSENSVPNKKILQSLFVFEFFHALGHADRWIAAAEGTCSHCSRSAWTLTQELPIVAL